MTKKSQTLLFLFFVCLFFLIAPILVLYSQGYRLDIEKKRIVQTGGLFLKIQPTGADIYIDSKFQKKTNILFPSALIQNLIPKKHKIQVKKQGFFPWQKTLEIKEKQVTEAKNIILVPKNPKFEILAPYRTEDSNLELNKNINTENFWFSPSQKNLILKEVDKNGWHLKLYNTEKKVKSYLISEQDISKKQVEIIDLKFSADSKKILLKTGLKEQLKYFIIDLAKSPAGLIPLDFLGKNIEQVSFNPKDSTKIFFLKNNQLFEGNPIDKKISPAFLKDVLTYQVVSEKIYFLEKSGFIFETTLSFNHKEKLNKTPFRLKTETGYKLETLDDFIFLREEKNIYLFDLQSKSFKRFCEATVDLILSPDSKKIAYINNNEIWVFFLKDITGQPKRKTGDKVFLTRFSKKIDHIFWYSPFYLIFNCGNKIKVAEIDDRDTLNIVDLAKFNKPKIFFNQNNKKLYILSHGNLYVSEKLLR